MANILLNNPLGLFNYTYPDLTPGHLAEKLQSIGFSTIHLDPRTPAMLPPDGHLTAQWARHIRELFAANGIRIVALAGYTNLLNPDLLQREAGLQSLELLIEICQEFGTQYISTQSGSLSRRDPWGDCPENHTSVAWEQFLLIMQRLVRKAQDHDVKILIEGYVNNVISTPEEGLQLIYELGESGLGFIMDPFNFLTKEQLDRQEASLENIFNCLAQYSPLAHAKDTIYNELGISTPKAGAGKVDWPLVASCFRRYMPDVPIILEHLSADDVDSCTDFVKAAFLKKH